MSKRGRPIKYNKAVNDIMLNILDGHFPDTRSHRGRIDLCYRLRAIGVLDKVKDIDNIEFILDDKNKTFKPSILVQLGRIDNDELLIALARRICELAKTHKYKAKDIERFIRDFRLGRIKEADS
jgi:hypothetical protein